MSGRGRGRKPYPSEYGRYYKVDRPGRQSRPPQPPNVSPGVVPDAFGANSDGYRTFVDSLRMGQERQFVPRSGGRGGGGATNTPAQDRLMGRAGGSSQASTGENEKEKEKRYKEQQERLARLAMIESGADLGARSRGMRPAASAAAAAEAA